MHRHGGAASFRTSSFMVSFCFLPCRLAGLALLLAAPRAYAQADAVTPDSRLSGLLGERTVLTRQYAEASEQRHSLFGNKPSKRDLEEVVDALQGIVDKDQQIVDVLNETAQKAQTTSVHLAATTTHLETSSRDDRNLTAQRLTELQNEQQNFQARQRQATQRQRNLEADLHEAQQGRFVRDALIAGLAALSTVLAVLLLRRRA